MNLLALLPELTPNELAIIGTGYHYFKNGNDPDWNVPFCPPDRHFAESPMIVGLYDAEEALRCMQQWDAFERSLPYLKGANIIGHVSDKLKRYIEAQDEHASGTTSAT